MKILRLTAMLTVFGWCGVINGKADVIASLPPPEIRLILQVQPSRFDDVRRILMDFANDEHLKEFKDAPRARGKQFFLSVYSENYNFVAEKSAEGRPLVVECYDLHSSFSRVEAEAAHVPYFSESHFAQMVARLRQRLKAVSSEITTENQKLSSP